MKSVLHCFIIVCLIVVLDGRRQQRFRCDYKYFKEADGYLKYHEIPSDWHEARLRCRLEGAVLASPITKPLREAMTKMVNRSSVCGVFTGIHSIFSRGDFHSVEGVHLSDIPHSWTKGEPDNEEDGQGCITMLKDGTFADINCSETLPYICYKKTVPGMMLNACGTTDDRYILDPRTGSCYKLHTFPRTWSRAFMTCTAEGGYLAIINSDTEVQVIKDIRSKTPEIKNVVEYVKDNILIGFHDWNERGSWLTVHGESLQEAGYEKWSPGEPNNYTVGQFCGSVYPSGLLDDAWCHTRSQFLCEKNPEALLCPEED